ncbi:hypothetical protein [Roseibium litorale]|uniref:Mu-like prophage FluMu N-terminal domain-containing protein n=1 Tax=Roseibium litorale TaxID=2803841 RepID=A0ABR9CJS2_9HYPH|nr:hypothetical protein [Roseibium litorale]MBD8890904.1 hypothetical protein [Roseibium litorale]
MNFEDANAVIVTASRERWRAGRKFPANKPVTVPFSELSEEQARQLEADPLLSLRFVEVPDTASHDAAPGTILDAIEKLDREKDFNHDGTPKVQAVSKILERDVSKSEILAALGNAKAGEA